MVGGEHSLKMSAPYSGTLSLMVLRTAPITPGLLMTGFSDEVTSVVYTIQILMEYMVLNQQTWNMLQSLQSRIVYKKLGLVLCA